jgi:hypothetical protein
MTDRHGAPPPVHPYRGQDRPAGPGAEDEAVVGDGELAPGGQADAPDDAALPSQTEGHTEP